MLDNHNFGNKYLEFESPENIRRELYSDYEFKNWLRTFGTESLAIQLSNFEDSQMYEDCIIIKKILQSKINEITITYFEL